MTKTSRKWKHGDPRCDECDNGLEPDWKRCPFCDDSPREVGREMVSADLTQDGIEHAAILDSAIPRQRHRQEEPRCPRCNGKGYVPGDPEAAPIEDCPKCVGSGAIAKTPVSPRAPSLDHDFDEQLKASPREIALGKMLRKFMSFVGGMSFVPASDDAKATALVEEAKQVMGSISQTRPEDERGFLPGDYEHTAKLLLSSEDIRKAAASNNHNIILAALYRCAGIKLGEEPLGYSALSHAQKGE